MNNIPVLKGITPLPWSSSTTKKKFPKARVVFRMKNLMADIDHGIVDMEMVKREMSKIVYRSKLMPQDDDSVIEVALIGRKITSLDSHITKCMFDGEHEELDRN